MEKEFTGFMDHSMGQLKNINIPVPPYEDQGLISNYLDKKTEQIDRLVEKIQKKIDLLKEQRTSLINQYVTKGLDPNVEMKDSGVEWIGEIPRRVVRLKKILVNRKLQMVTKTPEFRNWYPISFTVKGWLNGIFESSENLSKRRLSRNVDHY